MAKYKRRPKLKHYRRSYYTRDMKLRRVVSVVLLVAAMLAVAWLAAPHVLDWATHTWYTVVRSRTLPEASSSSAAASAAPSTAAASEALPEPEPEEPEPAAPDGTAILSGSWAEVPLSALSDEASIRTAARQLSAQGVRYALITLKDEAGNLYYASDVPAAAGSTAGSRIDPQLAASILKENGLVPAAKLAAFRDPIASHTDRSLAIHYRSAEGATDYLWLDAVSAEAGGKSWLNPYSAGAVEFIGALLDEVHGMGFEQIVLSCVQFPSAVSGKQDFGDTGGVSRPAQLAKDIAAWQTRMDGKAALWLSYPLSACTGTKTTLGAPAAQLGMQNLMVTVPAASTMDAAQRAELTDALTAAGVEHVVLRDDAAAYFE